MIMQDATTINPYLELGIAPGITLKELRTAYRNAVRCYHPDTAQGAGSTRKFNAVTEAYKLLRETLENKVPVMGQNSNSFSGNRWQANPFSETRPQRSSSTFSGKRAQASKPQSSEARSQFSSASFSGKRPQSFASFSKFSGKRTRPTGIFLDRETQQLSMSDLMECIKYSDNPHVIQVAAKAIVMKKSYEGIRFLLELLPSLNSEMQQMIISALGERGLYQASSALTSFIAEGNIYVSIEAIKALEKISTVNRSHIRSLLKQRTTTNWDRIKTPFKYIGGILGGSAASRGTLGGILLQNKQLTEDQLEIALLLQKRSPLLLGQILRNLDYLSIPEVQHAIVLQKYSRY